MLNKSDNINELAAALSKAQSSLIAAKKDSKNPFFGSKYASLEAVWDSCRDTLGKNNLSICQTMAYHDGESFLCTTLLHSSGQFLQGEQRLNPVKNDPQGMGSSISYARRYGLSAILGIVADEDDDGNAASGNKEKAEDKVQKAERDDIETLRKQAKALSSDVERKTLAERMTASGEYQKEVVKYVTGFEK